MANPISRVIADYARKRLFGYGPTDDWSAVDRFQGPSKDIKLLGLYSGLTYACINAISEEVGKYEPYLYTLDNSGNQTTRAVHPFLTVIKNPNPGLSMYQLFEGSASFVEQFGEFFWYMVGGEKTGYQYGVKQVYLLRPDRMGITVDKDSGEVIGYTYNAGGGNRVPFTPDEIIHHMTFNPKNPYRGFSTVEAAIDYIMTEEEVSRFTRNYFRNNAAMSGVLNVSGKVSKESWQKFVRQWRERYQGVENAGKVALVRDSQVEFTPTGSNLNDMQLSELKQTTMEQILMMFRIPKGIFGMESEAGLGRASVETLEYIFAKRTIDPKLCRLDDTLQKIMDKYYAKDKLQVGHRNIIPADKEFELSVFNQGVDRWLTRGEIRSKNPDTANTPVSGDEQLFVPINMVPIGDPATPGATSTSGLKVKVSKKKVVKSFEYSTTQKEAFRSGLEKNSNRYISTYKKGLHKVLSKQLKTVISNISHLSGKDLSDVLMSLSDEDQNFQDALIPILTQLVLEQGQLAIEFAGSSDQYSLSRSIQAAITASTKKMSNNFNEETLHQLNDTLIAGVSNGEGLDSLTSRVESVYEEATGYRAERVARTESMGASNDATLDAYKQTSYVTAMQWFANPDACPYCEELNGTTVGLEQVFVNSGDSVDVTSDDGSTSSYNADYGDVETPPLHPNCACTIIPITSVDQGQ